MKHIGIMPNLLKDNHLEITKIVAKWLVQEGFEVYGARHIAEQVQDIPNALNEEEIYKLCDIVIAIGGDGTILSVAEKAYSFNVPIVGVNLGRLGFLADIEPSDIASSLKKLLDKDYEIEERMMLEAKIIAPNGHEYVFHALNDVSITRGSSARIAEFEILVNGTFCDVYPADGVIVSTPTGSTAYNLSAGGPIVVPHAKAYIVTPICPHTIYSKSIIMSEEDTVQIKIGQNDSMNIELNIDGKMKMYLTPNHFVQIQKSTYVTRLVKLSELKFFEILRKKIVERRR
ncbi:NAD(+)/NADH kinase [Cellulosilyticum sp. I15G10I2]|uniref:NAD(+)/NADH kinase n=1 Tax=Cellulosilyticum sp. I15G10I2 TaxID=1892843 RepID=UPI00085C9174|nr:NAD(+)/NADH kinase [Cellulosilyticum sp. I15G10I2]